MTKWLVGQGEFSGERDGVILALEGCEDVEVLARRPSEKKMRELAHELTDWFINWDSEDDDPKDLSDDKVSLDFSNYSNMVYLSNDDCDQYLVAVKIEF